MLGPSPRKLAPVEGSEHEHSPHDAVLLQLIDEAEREAHRAVEGQLRNDEEDCHGLAMVAPAGRTFKRRWAATCALNWPEAFVCRAGTLFPRKVGTTYEPRRKSRNQRICARRRAPAERRHRRGRGGDRRPLPESGRLRV